MKSPQFHVLLTATRPLVTQLNERSSYSVLQSMIIPVNNLEVKFTVNALAVSCQYFTVQSMGFFTVLRLRSAWASALSDQSPLCAQWVAKSSRFLYADNEDSDQTEHMPRLI